MKITDRAVDDNIMLLNLLEHRSGLQYRKENPRLEGLPRPGMDCKIHIHTDDHRLTDTSTFYRKLLTTDHTTHSGPHPLPNTSLPAITPPPFSLQGFLLIFLIRSGSAALFQNPCATEQRFFDTYRHSAQDQETRISWFFRVVDTRRYHLLSTM